MKALIESRTSHNFLKKELDDDLGIRDQHCNALVKDTNSMAKKTTGSASKVHIHLGKWKGHAKFTVVLLDDFDLILR